MGLQVQAAESQAEASAEHDASCLHLLRGAAGGVALVHGGASLRKRLLRGARKVLKAGYWSDAPIVLQAAGPPMLQPKINLISLCF